MMQLNQTRLLPGAMLTVILLLSGCGGGVELPGEAGTVTGTITYKGEPAPVGTTVMMLHTKQGVVGAGEVDAEGNFTLQMRGSTDILVGDYVVGINPPTNPAVEPATDPDKEVPEPESWKKIPKKYRNQDTSGETFTVKVGENSYTLDMEEETNSK